MATPKLIVIEGIPGSGKTSTAKFVQKWLDEHQRPNRLYLEGDLDHPADFESVAYFTRDEWTQFLTRYPAQRAQFERAVDVQGDDRFINYRKLKLPDGQDLPAEIFNDLAQRDVYEVPSADIYCRLALERWQRFAEYAQNQPETYVFECCLMQNPMTVLTLKHNWAYQYTIRHIRRILTTIRRLDPVIIYLYQAYSQTTLMRLVSKRPKEWQDFVIAYIERGAWSQAKGRHGYQAFIDHLGERQAIELEFIFQLEEIPHIEIADPELDWDQSHDKISKFLSEVF